MLQLLAQASDYDYAPDIQFDSGAATGIMAALGGMMIFIFILIVLAAGFTIWMLVDAILRSDNEYPGGSGKVMWILLLVFLGFIPAIIYYFMVKKSIPRGSGGQAAPQNTQPPSDKMPPPVE